MTRYNGRPIKPSSVDDILLEEVSKITATNTIKFKIYKYIKNHDKPFLVNDIHRAVSPTSSRRVIERALTNLTVQGIIKRERCICGCSYIYKK